MQLYLARGREPFSSRRNGLAHLNGQLSRALQIVRNPREVSVTCVVHPHTIYRLVRSRQLPAFRIGSDRALTSMVASAGAKGGTRRCRPSDRSMRRAERERSRLVVTLP